MQLAKKNTIRVSDTFSFFRYKQSTFLLKSASEIKRLLKNRYTHTGHHPVNQTLKIAPTRTSNFFNNRLFPVLTASSTTFPEMNMFDEESDLSFDRRGRF